MRLRSRRWTWRLVWVALACALSLSMAQLGWSAKADVDPRPAPIDWGSAPAERSELRPYTARSEKLLRLVNDNRVQLFPRGVAELEAEDAVVRPLYPQMLLDPHLLIVYPFAGFFYVAPENTKLAAAIQTGFERVIADGSCQRLVEETIMTPWLRRQLKLRSRRILLLQNPEAAEVLADVNPDHWIIAWNDLLSGRITSGNDLCSSSGLKRLCVN